MAEDKPEQEPSIEEILASIRQIISDDDEQPQKAEAAAPVIEPEPEPEEPEDDDVLELTESMQEEPDLTPDEGGDEPDLDDFEIALAEINETLSATVEPDEEEDIEVEIEEEEMPADNAAPDDFDDILSEQVRNAALSSMARLASGMPVSKPDNTPRHYDGVTLEDIVRDLLHPMLREWMDDNLPSLVERIVQKEMEKLARKALDS